VQEYGEFFMSFEDFFREFDSIDFVHINLNAFYNVGKEYERMIEWDNKFFTGAWIKGKTAGGLYLLTNVLIHLTIFLSRERYRDRPITYLVPSALFCLKYSLDSLIRTDHEL
jgi:hypothetical protein